MSYIGTNRRRSKRLLRLGVNVDSRVRLCRMSKPDSTSTAWRAVEFMGQTSQKSVDNVWLTQKLTSALPSDDSDSQEIRLRDLYRAKLRHRQKMSRLYGRRIRFSSSVRASLLRRQMSGLNDGQSRLSSLESRLDVVLCRSGLCSSVPMAVEWIRSGHVYVDFGAGSSSSLDVRGVKVYHPGFKRIPGAVVSVERSFWQSQAVRLRDVYWKVEGNERSVPSYLRVSWQHGMVSMLDFPRDGEILMPTSMSFSLDALRRS